MAQQDLGGSCTAQRYCHSDALISGHVCAEQGGESEKQATIKLLVLCTRKRQSSYSHNGRSTFSGGLASLKAVTRVMGVVVVGLSDLVLS